MAHDPLLNSSYHSPCENDNIYVLHWEELDIIQLLWNLIQKKMRDHHIIQFHQDFTVLLAREKVIFTSIVPIIPVIIVTCGPQDTEFRTVGIVEPGGFNIVGGYC